MSLVRHVLTLDAEADDDALALPLAELAPIEGETVAGFLARARWPVDLLPSVVRHGEDYLSRAEWDLVRIRATDAIVVVSRPAGGAGGGGRGGGKSIGAAVAMIALSVLAPWAAPLLLGGSGGALAGALGASGFSLASSVLAAGIVAGGGLLLSHFLKPKAARTAPETPLYSFALAGNNARPLQMIPVGYGRRLIAPDFASPTYSEFDGDSMTSYGLYAIGCGRYQIEEIRLDDTTIWTAGGGPEGVGESMTFQVVEPGDDVTLFPINVISASEVTGQQLENAYSAGGWVGPFAVNPAGTQAREILVDFVLPNGCFATYKERTFGVFVNIRVEARTIDDAGAPTSGWSAIIDEPLYFAKKSAIRLTKRATVTPARYEVRIGRAEEPFAERFNNSAVQGQDDIAVSALRCHIDGPQSFPGVTTLAVRATADANLQAVNQGNVKVIAQRILPVWNGASWVEEPTRSIAWAAADVWRNADYSAGLPDRGLDLATFLAFAEFWDEAEHTFDHWFSEPSSVVDAIETILKAGRAVPDLVGDTLSIVRDEARALPELLFTDREIVRGSFARTYALPDARVADGIFGQYLDETTWRLAEVSSAPDDTPLAKPARVELVGVTKRAQAAGLVRFMQAENQYRRVTLSFSVEAEGRLLKRGQALAVQTEEPQTWGAGGEVLHYDGATRTLTLDPAPSWAAASSYWVEVRCRDGAYFGPMRVTQGARPALAILDADDLDDVETAVGRTIAAALARGPSEDNPSFVWGPGEPRAYRVLLREGSPSGELMRLTCIRDDPRVYDVTETGVPALPTVPAFLDPNAAPTISQLSATMRQEGALAMLTATWQPNGVARRYVAQIRYATAAPLDPEETAGEDSDTWSKVYEGDLPSLKLQVSPADLQLRVASLNDKNVQGPWSVVSVEGIDLIISTETNWLVVDIDAFRPDALDRAVLDPIFDSDADELAAFSDRVVATRLWETGDQHIGARVKESVALYADAREAIAGLQTVVFAKFRTADATITQQAQAIASADRSIANLQTQVAANFASLSASITTTNEAVADAETAIATLSDSLTAVIAGEIAPLSATVEAQATAIADIEGGVYGQWAVQIVTQSETGGGSFQKVSGFGLVQAGGGGDVVSEFNIAVDQFNVLPAVSTGTPTTKQPVFTIGTVGGVAAVGIHGDLYLDGTIAAQALVVEELSALTANVGELTAGIIKSPDNKMVIDLDAGSITISD